VYAISCLVHGFVVLTLAKDFPACCISGDSVEYLKLANAGWSNLNRTPVYPAFLWLVRRIFGPSLEPVLWIQVFFLSLGPAFVALFASLAFPGFPKVAYISGLLSSVSFTGIKVGYMILTEALFAPLSMGGLVALYFGARQCKETFIVLSAVLGGLAFLVKPIFLFWWFFIPIFVFFFAGKHKPGLKVVLLAMALGLAFPLGWSLVNFIKYRIFTPSWSGVATICIYWGARTVAIAEEYRPGRGQIEDRRKRILELYESLGTLVQRYRFFSEECPHILIARPVAAMKAYWVSAFENLPRPFSTAELGWSPVAVSGSMNTLHLATNGLNVLLYIVAFFGAVRMIAEREGRLLLGLLLFFGMFWLLTATSYGQGSRLMYPAEPVLMLLTGLALASKEPLSALNLET